MRGYKTAKTTPATSESPRIAWIQNESNIILVPHTPDPDVSCEVLVMAGVVGVVTALASQELIAEATAAASVPQWDLHPPHSDCTHLRIAGHSNKSRQHSNIGIQLY
jgi:hypothetical protein